MKNVIHEIAPRTNDIGGFEVQRLLPYRKCRMVGPFIFWDQMGPGEFVSGKGVDVRPHPHIGLSTMTYLFDGSLDHRDSLGTYQRIKEGDVNLMTAGKGIVHSERTGQDIRVDASNLFGIQSWLALPEKEEQRDCSFDHYKKENIPLISEKNMKAKIVMGEYEQNKSPVRTFWETIYIDISLGSGEKFKCPRADELAVFVLDGNVKLNGHGVDKGMMYVVDTKYNNVLSVDNEEKNPARLLILGGATMDSQRHIWWNFVASDQELIEQAKKRWKQGEFPVVPDDDEEFIPLPS